VTAREASIFACLVDTVAAPGPLLPPVAETDAVRFFGEYLARSPRTNAIGLRALLTAADVGPLALGFRRRLRALAPADRARYLDRLERSPARQLAKALKGIALLCYYGDDGLLVRIGYDPDANLRRARELRVREGRP
jgi:hypothetical protein